jgi:HK97 family phage major capsid protein
LTEADALLARDSITTDERGRVDIILEEVATLDRDLERRATLARAMTEGGSVETGDGAKFRTDAFNVSRNRSALDLMHSATREGSEDSDAGRRLLRDAAARQLDDWQARGVRASSCEAADIMLKREGSLTRNGARIAQHVVALSDPEYVDAFHRYLAGGPSVLNGDEIRALQRGESLARTALNEGNNTQGGFTVPPFLDPTINLTNTGIIGSIRAASTVKTITTQVWKGITSAGVTAEWTAEAAEMTDASPTFSQPTITPVRGDAYVQASFEMLEDTAIAQDLADLFADAFERITETAYITGTGSTQPFGIVNELDTVTASRVSSQTAGVFGAIDIFSTDSALPARYRRNASWVMAPKTINNARQFAVGAATYSPSTFLVDFGGATPSVLLGRPLIEHSAMPSTVTSSGDLVVYGDFRAGYFLVDRLGMSVAYNPLVIGTSRRPTGECGWACFWRTGAATINNDAFRMLRIT